MTFREIAQHDIPALFPIRATRENPLSRTELQSLGITERIRRPFSFYQRHGWLVSEINADVLSMKKVRP